MSDVDQIVTRIKRRLSRSNVAGLDTTIIDELNNTQEELESRSTLPSFIVTTEQIVLVAADDIIDVSADLTAKFLRFLDDSPVQLHFENADETWQPVPRFITQEELKSRWPGAGSQPRGWSFTYPNLMVRPTPDTSITLKLQFYERVAPMAAGNSTAWTTNASELLIAQTGIEVAQQLRDANARAYFVEKYKIANKNYIQRLSAEEMAGLSTSRGED